MSSMLVVGSVAFDTLHNARGSFPRVIGGSATYASLAGSFFTEVQLVGVVGKDFPDDLVQTMRGRGIDCDGLEVADGPTFHWEGRYTDDLTSRTSLKTELGVFADFDPKIPEKFRSTPFVMLGNIAPELQIAVLDQVKSPKLVVADTMNFWIDGARPALEKLLKRVDVLVINEEEARQLTGKHHMIQVAAKLLEMGPKTAVIKQGEYGAWLFAGQHVFNAPAFLLEAVDPTGAGDSFAGGFLGYVARAGNLEPETLKQAVIYGSAVASFCVEGIAVDRLLTLTREEIVNRVHDFRKLVDFQIGH
ncbi:MAG: bifunctional hydroxymethylpyrimidine kinase/phosphomethylpyrimidine kinase [Sandaracinus sp.]|nr:bifunctional hydroxymethylpyrimidine kinase/phosphomethylpyrimidine kinase [Sandaracinus sp.]MCB9602790.1 bifunctional hydroxymethylpyrimidine kinase/phosphomethylpyrimidine kinase [Sandaracinus sp.]MCB9612468.1 bifunctional hydroxymethylpyrimidine kinase/phosphomethylpyrimidine kinase [Sandaracinus sp.]MCB9619075.1 bifunctional hydroxymethylpyrimidine kinase/phosphomethylpyrimidine kinase [Sandaracinus sp.]